jgi:aspartate-semialdehyde dehydrogenase
VSLRVGIVGATGAVGSTMLEVLAERSFPAEEVVAFSSQRSAGSEVGFGDSRLECRPLTSESIGALDLVLSSAGGAVSAEWAPRLVEAGAVVIDNTSSWRMHEEVPLVVAEVNPEALEAHRGIVANPNCSAMQMVVALAPIHRAVGIERIVVSTYQPVSGTGRRAMEELRAQAHALLHEAGPPQPEVYPHRIAFNVIPQVETFKGGDDYTTEERKMMAETRKILGVSEDEMRISATCVRVPVLMGESE